MSGYADAVQRSQSRVVLDACAVDSAFFAFGSWLGTVVAATGNIGIGAPAPPHVGYVGAWRWKNPHACFPDLRNDGYRTRLPRGLHGVYLSPSA